MDGTTLQYTVDSRYYDNAGIRKMYQYIQTIDITSLNLYCFVFAWDTDMVL
jgi:hypothetical protein